MSLVFFFNDTATTEIYTLSLHDALPISGQQIEPPRTADEPWTKTFLAHPVPFKPGTHFLYNTSATYMLSAIVQKATGQDRKSTRLNSSHANISYAVFCLKKKKKR